MKNFLLMLALLGAAAAAPVILIAQYEEGSVPESIESFHADIYVNPDNSIDVEESIVYNSGPQPRHGIYRDINLYSSQKRRMDIAIDSIIDENGDPYKYEASNQGDILSIKIGDPARVFKGKKNYFIKYHATRAVAQFDQFDEIYWNTTGNNWNIPIYKASASVSLPGGAAALQTACYHGKKGSTTQCDSQGQGGAHSFYPPALGPSEGFTVAVGFPKGVVAPYSAADNTRNFFDIYWPWILGALLPILTFVFSLRYWYKHGRDPKGTGVIVPQYDVPDRLTPMEVGGIVNEKVSASNISAEIIYLATEGYLKIAQLEEKFMGLIKTTDYELTRLKNPSDLPNQFDKSLMEALFPDNSKVRLSSLKNHFYSHISGITKGVLDNLLSKNYYKHLGSMKTPLGGVARLVVVMLIAFFAAGLLGGVIGGVVLRGNPLPLIIGIFLSVVIYGIISHFSPAKTPKGVAAKEYILGLKDYMQIAEKDRLHFHNAPDKKPEVFEHLLPYAMVLGVADIWAKEFEGIYMTPPSWYSGPAGAHFGAAAFSHDLAHFSSFANSSLSSSPQGSGSGGGGFSGGGGGGGGGGGW